MWVRISEKVRTQTGFDSVTNQSQMNSFINNDKEIYLNNSETAVSELQPLSSVLAPTPDSLPPIV